MKTFSFKLAVSALALLLVGCSRQSNVPEKGVNVRTTCYQGVLYFSVWNNNAFDSPYLTCAVIDQVTSLPKRCKE